MRMKHGFEYRIISPVKVFKFLGIYFDQNLTFKHHTSYLTNRLSQVASMLYSIRNFLPAFIQRILYFTHVNSILSYCITIWGGTKQTHLNSLILVQKRIIRIINNAGFREHTRPLFKTSKILNVGDLYKYILLQDYFKTIQQNRNHPRVRHNYLTRNRHILNPDRHKRSIFESSFMYRGPKSFNSLPLRIQSKQTHRGT